MKKLLGLGLLAAAFLCLAQSPAKAGVTQTYRIEVSTPTDTPILMVTGPGTLFQVDCSSGATTSWSLGFDSASISGITINTAGKAITPQVFSSGQTAASVPNSGWKTVAEAPAQFLNGLVVITHGGAINCQYRVGPPSGS